MANKKDVSDLIFLYSKLKFALKMNNGIKESYREFIEKYKEVTGKDWEENFLTKNKNEIKELLDDEIDSEGRMYNE